MKFRLANLWWILLAIFVVALIYALVSSGPAVNIAEKDLAATKATLRHQGFKTELSDFNFSTSSEMIARETALTDTALGSNLNPPQFADHPNLMEAMADNYVVVVWKAALLKRQFPLGPDTGDDFTWDE